MRREAIYPHKSVRRLAFRGSALLEGLAVAILSDLVLVWQLPKILEGHSRTVTALLELAAVPWETGRSVSLLPGVSTHLLRTPYLDYQEHPLYPWYFLGGTAAVFLIAYGRMPAPLKPILFLLPLSLAITLLYLKTVWPAVPYTAEDFCAIWYHGEVYLWLLLPWVVVLGLFLLHRSLLWKLSWLAVTVCYSLLWSAVRLALALATFYHLGPLWMPFFYFAFGFLADFLYIVAFYSLATDQAARVLADRRKAWQ